MRRKIAKSESGNPGTWWLPEGAKNRSWRALIAVEHYLEMMRPTPLKKMAT